MLPFPKHEVDLFDVIVQLLMEFIEEVHEGEGFDWEVAGGAPIEDIGLADNLPGWWGYSAEGTSPDHEGYCRGPMVPCLLQTRGHSFHSSF